MIMSDMYIYLSIHTHTQWLYSEGMRERLFIKILFKFIVKARGIENLNYMTVIHEHLLVSKLRT